MCKTKGFNNNKWQNSILQDFLNVSLNRQRGDSSIHKHINMPKWGNKEPEYQAWLSKTSEPCTQKALCSRCKQNTNSEHSEDTQNWSKRGTAECFQKAQITRWLTWHNVTDRDESSVLQTGKITQQLPIKHAIPVPNRIVLKKMETWGPCNPPTRSSSW